MTCCGRMADPGRAALLDRLAREGVRLPFGAQIWGRRPDGTEWHLVDRMGNDPPDGPIFGYHTVGETVAAERINIRPEGVVLPAR